ATVAQPVTYADVLHELEIQLQRYQEWHSANQAKPDATVVVEFVDKAVELASRLERSSWSKLSTNGHEVGAHTAALAAARDALIHLQSESRELTNEQLDHLASGTLALVQSIADRVSLEVSALAEVEHMISEQVYNYVLLKERGRLGVPSAKGFKRRFRRTW